MTNLNKSTIWTYPNLLTACRIISSPWLAYEILAGHYHYALIILIGASLTDLLDGYVARHFHQTSKIGMWLDPLADKILMLSLFIPLIIVSKNTSAPIVPLWLGSLIIGRDMVIIGGVYILKFLKIPSSFKPYLISKINTFLQLMLGILGLAALAFRTKLIHMPPLWYGVAGTTCISGILYISEGFRRIKSLWITT